MFKKGSVSRGSAQAEANRSVKAGGGQLRRAYESAIQGFHVDIPTQAVGRLKAANPKIAYCEQD